MSIFSAEVRSGLDSCVLCWLATATESGLPNVSPKEGWCIYQDRVIVANIASPGSLRNLRSNAQVAIGFLDIFKQKGYQMKGTGRVVDASAPEFSAMALALTDVIGASFPFAQIMVITVDTIKPIIAPGYFMVKGTTEANQIASAKKRYGVGD